MNWSFGLLHACVREWRGGHMEKATLLRRIIVMSTIWTYRFQSYVPQGCDLFTLKYTQAQCSHDGEAIFTKCQRIIITQVCRTAWSMFENKF